MNLKKLLSVLVALIMTVSVVAVLSSLAIAANPTPKAGDSIAADIEWSRTSEPSGRAGLRVASWSWSDIEKIDVNSTGNVWDGGSVGPRYIGSAQRDWDIATWHTTRNTWLDNPDSKTKMAMADVRRFSGKFTIPEGYTVNDDVTLASVGDYSNLGLGDIIAINDNIYVFVHPKDIQLDNSNYMDYLAFWTGSALQPAATNYIGHEVTFNGVSGTAAYDYKTVAGGALNQNHLLSHTDGWYCDAPQNNVGAIMKKCEGYTEFVIDVVVEDYAEDGGMDRMGLTFTKIAQPEVEMGYTVEYYKDGVLVDGDTQAITKNVPSDSVSVDVDVDDINTTDKYEGYEFSHTDPGDVPTEIADGGVIRVYYITPEEDDEDDDTPVATGGTTQNTDPEDTDPEDTDPEDTDPEDTDPEDTDPEDTDPEDTDPEDTDPEDTDPKNTDPENTDPENTDPDSTDPDNSTPPLLYVINTPEGPVPVPTFYGYESDSYRTSGTGYTIIRDTGAKIGDLVRNDDTAGYVLIDNDAVPLGEWNYDDGESKWIYDQYPPLSDLPVSNLPTTGGKGIVMFGLAGLLLVAGGVTLKRRSRD